MIKAGDLVKVITKNKVEKGILMPNYDEDSVIIKLSNGYNVGFIKKDVKGIKLIKSGKNVKSNHLQKVKKNSKLKTITILHCGGTIASKVDYETGAVKAKFSPEELLEMFPELKNIVNLRSKLVSNMLSENMRFAHYNIIAKEVEKEIKAGSQGIIITHGTDTLHYTAIALSFILENLNVPVLLVGAQRSSDRGSSDAFLNLKSAAVFIAGTNYSNVATCMHHSTEDNFCAIIRGIRSRKMHSSRRDAFKAINCLADALIDTDGKIKWLNKNNSKNSVQSEKLKQKLNLKLFKDNIKIGLLKARPQMFVEEIKLYEKFDGLILEGTGLGHFPIERYDSNTLENEKIFIELKKLVKKMPIVMTTQTIYGGINMNVYSPGRKLINIGILGNLLDLTTETAYLKLAWLLSNYKKNEIKSLWSENFRGEINLKRIYQQDFLK